MELKDTEIANEPTIDYNGSYTYADYAQFKIEEMVELIRGKIYRMSPAPRSVHQTILGNLHLVLGHFLKNQRCKVFLAPTDVILPIANKRRESATTVVQPDIVVVCNPEMIEEAGIFGVPDWVVEILSPHTSKKDLQLKYDVYEEAGIGEYWIVMPDQQLVEVFVLVHGKYQRTTTYVKEDTVTSHTLPELSIDLVEVFD